MQTTSHTWTLTFRVHVLLGASSIALLSCVFVSATMVAKDAWENHYPIKWEDVSVVDMARHPKELLLKKAVHIQMIPTKEHFNRDTEIELPVCWMATLRSQEARTK